MFVLRCACVAMLLFTGCERIKNTPKPLAKKATMAIHVVSPTNTPGAKQATYPDTKSTLFLTMPAIITAADVATVQRSSDPGGMPLLTFNLTPAGSTKLATATATATPAGMQLALLINGTVVSTPKLMTPLSKSFVINAGADAKIHETWFDALTKN